MKKKLFSLLMILAMVLSLLPASVFADGEDVPEYHGFVEALNFSCVNPNELLCPYEGSEFDKNKHEYNMVLTDTGFKNTQIIISEEHAQAQDLFYSFILDGKAVKDPILLKSAKTVAVGLNTGIDDKKLPVGTKHTIEVRVGTVDSTKKNFVEYDSYIYNVTRGISLKTFEVFDKDGTKLAENPSYLTGKLPASVTQRDFAVVTESETVKLNLVPGTASVVISVGGEKFDAEKEYAVDNFKEDGSEIAIIPVHLDFTEEGKDHLENDYKIIVIKKDYTPVVEPIEDKVCDKGALEPLVAKASVAAGTLSYQWYKGDRPIPGATEASYTPDIRYASTDYYHCKVQNTVDGMTFETVSNTVSYTVNRNFLSAPLVTGLNTEGEHKPIFYTNDSVTLYFLVDESKGGTPIEGVPYEFQVWRRKAGTDDALEEITGCVLHRIDNTTGRGGYIMQLPSQSILGSYEYYVSASVYEEGMNRDTAYSNVLKLTYKDVADVVTELEGSGSVEDPFIVYSQKDLEYIKGLVEGKDGTPFNFSGQNIAFANDIELDSTWEPMGCIYPKEKIKEGYQDCELGVNIRPFSGRIDGKGFTLTVADMGRPLLGYVRSADVKNLNIYGTHIKGYGLVDNYVVDYGTKGNYLSETFDTIRIDNVTIKSGSKILQSGFIGGYASGINYVRINNCLVEKGVVIGDDGSWGELDYDDYNYSLVGMANIQDMIGSFAGAFNGYITSSTSYATVYGRNYVGGLLGIKGQSMGPCDVINSAFLGTIVATGTKIGGIAGSGYNASSAPGTPVVSIKNSYVSADITGKDEVGGIVGSESGHHDYSDDPDEFGIQGALSIDTTFYYGKLTATDGTAVGGIIGSVYDFSMHRGNPANYYLEGCGAASAIGKANSGLLEGLEHYALAESAGHFADGTVLAALNGNDHSLKNWLQSEKHPVFSDEAVISAIIIEGEPKLEYILGEEFDTTGIILKAEWSNGEITELDLKDVTISGYDKNTRGEQTVTFSYGPISAELVVTVLKPAGADITVAISVLGDSVHGDESEEVHTYEDGNLTVWVPSKSYTVNNNATVLDVLDLVFAENGITASNPSGNYIETLTFNGVTIGEFTNGSNSGWMYLLNGVHSNLGVSEQYLEDDDIIIFHYTDDYTKESAIGGGEDEPLNPIKPVSGKELEDIYITTGDFLENAGTPAVGSVGGEWMVIGLARSDRNVPKGYYDNVIAYVQENINEKEQLHKNKSTDNSRLILALTAMGYDVTNVDGHNLLAGFTDMNYVKKQGINGPIWALIALDSHDYEIPSGSTVTRDALIAAILDAQLPDGGWALSGKTSDPDMTAMALQALAKYKDANTEAIEKGISCLSGMQNDNGGYVSWGTSNSESCAQVVVALTALGINPKTDERFVKNGVSVMDALASFYAEGGGFKHVYDGSRDGMATEQGYYALASYYRMLAGKTSLYDMSDVVLQTEPTEPTEPIEYKIIKGSDSKIDLAKLEDTLFTSNADFSKFVKVLVDGKVVDPKYYDAKSGSTQITLKKAYLGTLSVGVHTLTIASTDGEASTKFTILPNTDPAPNTGDTTNTALWGAMTAVSLAALIACIEELKKKKRA